MSPSALEGLLDGLWAIHPSRLTALGNERCRRRPKRHIAFDASGWRLFESAFRRRFGSCGVSQGVWSVVTVDAGVLLVLTVNTCRQPGGVPGRARIELRLRRRGPGRHGRPRLPGKGRPQAACRAGEDVLPARRTAGPEHRRGPAQRRTVHPHAAMGPGPSPRSRHLPGGAAGRVTGRQLTASRSSRGGFQGHRGWTPR